MKSALPERPASRQVCARCDHRKVDPPPPRARRPIEIEGKLTEAERAMAGIDSKP